MSLLVVIAYANTAANDFAWDDHFIIARNTLITKLESIPALFTKDYWASRRDPNEAVPSPTTGLYRPFVMVTYALNYAVGKLDPFGYHFVNLLLHLLVTGLVYLIGLHLRCSWAAALAGAAIFAVHPLHTEAVTAIVGRAELMMAASVLGGFLLDLRGHRPLALVVFALGLFSKEQAMVLPVLLFLYHLCVRHPVTDSGKPPALVPAAVATLLPYAGYLAVLGVYLAVRALALAGLHPPPLGFLENPAVFADWPTRALTLVMVAGQYLWLSLWPASLSADYSYNAIPLVRSWWDPGVLWGFLAWGSLIGAALWIVRRDGRVTFCIAMVLVTFLPVSNFLVPIATIMGERFFYLPSSGLCLLLALGWDAAVVRLRPPWGASVAFAVVGVLCVAMTVRTIARNRDWVNTETLFRRAAEVVPDNAKVYFWLAKPLKDRGQRQEALRVYETALRLYPAFATTEPVFLTGYADMLIQLGRLEDGTRALEAAVRLEPEWSISHYNLGLAYAWGKNYERAEQEWRQALALNPRAPYIHNSLSRLFIERGRFAEALAEAETALQEDPNFLIAQGNRAWALEGLGRLTEAISEYERVLAHNPDSAELKERLIRLRERMGTAAKSRPCQPGAIGC